LGRNILDFSYMYTRVGVAGVAGAYTHALICLFSIYI